MSAGGNPVWGYLPDLSWVRSGTSDGALGRRWDAGALP